MLYAIRGKNAVNSEYGNGQQKQTEGDCSRSMSAFPTVDTRRWGEETSHDGSVKSIPLVLSRQYMTLRELCMKSGSRCLPAKQWALSVALSKLQGT